MVEEVLKKSHINLLNYVVMLTHLMVMVIQLYRRHALLILSLETNFVSTEMVIWAGTK